jgi:shikimate kinase
MGRNIYIIGFMGTGKTSVAKLLSEKIGYDFIDIDKSIEERINMPINEIFERFGEAEFRKIESEVLLNITSKNNLIVSTGGGIVLNLANLENMKASGYIITLIATPDVIYDRTKLSNLRPLLNKKNKLDEIKRLLYMRAPLYIKGDFILDTSDITANEAADEIVEFLNEANCRSKT